MIGKKINQLATELAPTTTDLTIIGDPVTGVSKKITLEQLGAIFGGAVSFYTTLGDFPVTGVIDIIYCAKDTKKLYLWSGSAYVEVFPSQSLLDTYQLRSEKGVSNGYASLDVNGKVPIGQLPNSIMEYKGTWNAATNTPTLANGTGDTGDVYICSVAGTVNFGSGPITFAVGDYVVYSGTIWQRSSGAVGTVTSVGLSITGDAIGVSNSPITTSGTLALAFAGTGAQYIKGDGTLATFPSIISQAQNLITEVYNNTGATLTKGTIVYINGGQGNLPTVTKALATSDATSAQTYGVVQTDITNMNNGYVVVEGRLSDLDTQAYANGTQLYLSPTTAGTWTSTKPYAPNHLVYVGIVVRSHPTQGVVEVKIMNGFEMDELHNVAAQSPDNNDILQYKTATSLWTKVAGTTTNIAEGSNLYYTDARSRAALSFTAGSGAYNSTTGVITIPTNTNQLTNGASFITLASLSAGAGISYNNTTGVIASTITQYTDALARAAISLTTTGTSGAATYNNTTGVLNIPQYQTALTNPVTGTGTTNYLPKFTGTSTIGNSIVQESGSSISVAGSINISGNFPIILNSVTGVSSQQLQYQNNGTNKWQLYLDTSNNSFNFFSSANAANRLTLTEAGNLGLGVTPSAWSSIFNVIQGPQGSVVAFQNNGPSLKIGSNFYYSSLGQYEYINTNPATRYEMDTSHRWSTAPSGTAGNAISFTQAMTLNASGNLSIGNTNDTYKLDVSGTGRFTGAITVNLTSAASAINLVNTSTNNIFTTYSNASNNTYIGLVGNNGVVQTNNDFEVYTGASYTKRLTIASTGAATFSSSVTAATESNFTGTSVNSRILVTASGVANTVLGFNNSGSTATGVSNNTGYVGILQAYPLAFITDSVERMRIGTLGTADVRIGGNFSPFAEAGRGALNINGASNTIVSLTTGGTARGYIYHAGTNMAIANFTNGGSLQFNTNDGGDVTRMTITSGGDLRFGNTGLNGQFIYGNSNEGYLNISGGEAAGQTYGGSITLVSNSRGGANTRGEISLNAGNTGGVGSYINFLTNASERMRITSDGNVGIGTTSNLNLGVPGTIALSVGGSTAYGGIQIRNSTGNLELFVGGATATDALIRNNMNGDLRFGTNGAERMRITSGGNVEINTGSIKTGEPDTGWGRAAIKIGASVSGAAFNVTRYLPVSVDGTVYFINLNSSTP